MKLFALVLFVLMYVLMITKPKYRPYYALGTGLIFLISGILPFAQLPAVINWNVLMMITGTMVLVDFFIASKMPNLMADILLDKCPNVMWVTISMSLFAGAISAFIDNIPYVATMLPVLSGIAAKTGINPCLLYFGLLTGATLGGNITPIGASANITGVGILRKEGYEVSFGQFARIGIPFTFVAVMGGYLLIWFLWS